MSVLPSASLSYARITVDTRGHVTLIGLNRPAKRNAVDIAMYTELAQAYGALRKGGTAVMVGVAGAKDTTTIRTGTLTFDEKTLTGSYYGSGRPREDFPRLLSLYKAGRLKLDELITHRYRIDEAPQAFADLESGRNARGVITF